MSRRKVVGTCHLCGAHGPLSFEHVPPRAAFNDQPVVLYHAQDMFDLGPDENPSGNGRISQRGLGAYTLCGRCNNKTGRWYSKRFAAWCHQGLETLLRAGGQPSLVYLHYLFPLAIIKQIATMFFSVNSDRFRDKHPELEHFVLDKERKGLSRRYRFFVYYNLTGRLRQAGVTGRLNMEAGEVLTFSELTFPPFGYVLSFDGGPPDPRLFEITHFTRFAHQEFAVTEIRLPVLPTHLWMPGDYRTREEILRDRDANERDLGPDV